VVESRFAQAGDPSLVAGGSDVDPTNTAQIWAEPELVIDALHPSCVVVMVGISLPADTR